MKILRLMSLVLFGTQFIMISDFTKASDEPEKQWPKECQKVEITSTADQSKQSAYFFKARSSNPRPLVVKLHACGRANLLLWLIQRFYQIHQKIRLLLLSLHFDLGNLIM